MRFSKISFSFIIALVLSLSAFVVSPSGKVIESAAVSSGRTGDCTWTLDGTRLTVSGSGAMEDYPFWKGKSAPWGTGLTAVTIENGVTKIGDAAFMSCAQLSDVMIPDSVTGIGEYASAAVSG